MSPCVQGVHQTTFRNHDPRRESLPMIRTTSPGVPPTKKLQHFSVDDSEHYRGLQPQPPVELMPSTSGEFPVADWVYNSTLSRPAQRRPGGLDAPAFFRAYQDYDNSATPRHDVMIPGLDSTEVARGRDEAYLTNIPWGSGETGGEGYGKENLIAADLRNYTPFTPPSESESTNMATPTLRRGYSVRSFSQDEDLVTDGDQGRNQLPPGAQGVGDGLDPSTPWISAAMGILRALDPGSALPVNLNDNTNKSKGGRGGSERNGWRDRLFGRGSNGAGSSGQVLQKGDYIWKNLND